MPAVVPLAHAVPRPATLPRVLFVCTGNICRSPTAHALLAHKARARGWAMQVDSAAVSSEEAGRPMDTRSARELQRRGYPPLTHCARQVVAADFARFDLLIGMTAAHAQALQRQRKRLAQVGAQAAVQVAQPLAQVQRMLDVLTGPLQGTGCARPLVRRRSGFHPRLRPHRPGRGRLADELAAGLTVTGADLRAQITRARCLLRLPHNQGGKRFAFALRLDLARVAER